MLRAVARIFQGSRASAKDAATMSWQASHRWQRVRYFIISRRLSRPAIVAIKLIHTLVFVALMGRVVFVSWAGVCNRMTRRAVVALLIIVGESIVISCNHGRCPLTDMV